jgi:hypothetical protein
MTAQGPFANNLKRLFFLTAAENDNGVKLTLPVLETIAGSYQPSRKEENDHHEHHS